MKKADVDDIVIMLEALRLEVRAGHEGQGTKAREALQLRSTQLALIVWKGRGLTDD